MNRFRKAWKAFWGTWTPGVKEVPVVIFAEPHLIDLYEVWIPDETSDRVETWEGKVLWSRHKPIYFATCEQAHAANAGRVEAKRAIRAGGMYLFADELREVQIAKPKVEKGRRA